ncbi:hypothetical protein [Amycolatopsis sp. NPDC059657]|uniref:hypothetical protein n=1 Tax=Amycolatopsis sp. NPDC059657 TaxID=3346899 RepID=UPI00366CB84C
MPTRQKRPHVLVLAAFAFAAAGCSTVTGQASPAGGSVKTTGPSSAAATSTAPTTTERPFMTVTPTLEITGDAAKPGTKVKFGEQAVIPVYSYYAKGLLGLTITTETVKASDEDIESLPLKDEDKAKLRGKYFFFVHQTLVNVDGSNLSELYPPSLTPATKSGGWPGQMFGGRKTSVTGCEETGSTPKDFTAKGAKHETCKIYFGVASDPITSIAYTTKPYDSAVSKAVTWKK